MPSFKDPLPASGPAIWLTWERQRRNQGLSKRLGARLFELEHNGGRLARYWVLTLRTAGILRQMRPRVVFFQNPSIVLALLVTTMKMLRLLDATTVGDFHNAGLHSSWGRLLVPWLVRHTDLIIVSNDSLRLEVEALGGRGIAIPDLIPEIQVPPGMATPLGGFSVFCICSWAEDEPIAQILRAAQILHVECPDVRMTISGRARLRSTGWTEPLPGNVQLSGFLAEREFDNLLAGSDAVLDLTTRADCMVCGAYEAISVGTPMILSDNEPSRLYFDSGALFTDNSAADIARKVIESRRRHAELKAGIGQLRAEVLNREVERIRELGALLDRHRTYSP